MIGIARPAPEFARSANRRPVDTRRIHACYVAVI
jgi:hypothetical protein